MSLGKASNAVFAPLGGGVGRASFPLLPFLSRKLTNFELQTWVEGFQHCHHAVRLYACQLGANIPISPILPWHTLSSHPHQVRDILEELELREGFECPPGKERGLVWEPSIPQQLAQTLFPQNATCHSSWDLTSSRPIYLPFLSPGN